MLTGLNEELAQLHTSANDLLAKVATEKREFTAEEKTNQAARFSRMKEIKGQLEQASELAAYKFETENATDKLERSLFNAGKKSEAKADFDRKTAKHEMTEKDQVAQYMKNPSSRNDAALFTITTGTTSGVMLGKTVLEPYSVRRIINPFRAALAYFGYKPTELPISQQLSLPVWNDLSNIADQPSESLTTNEASDPSTSNSLTLNPVLTSSKTMWFSNNVINAQNYNVVDKVLPVLQKRIDKGQESVWTTNATNTITNSYLVPSGQAGLGYADIIGWEHALNAAYRPDACFILHDTTYQAMRSIVDLNKRPIIQMGEDGGQFVEKIHQKPVFVSDYLAACKGVVKGTSSSSAANDTALCGLFISAEAIEIYDVVPYRLIAYVDQAAYVDQTGYNLVCYADCQFVNAGACFLEY